MVIVMVSMILMVVLGTVMTMILVIILCQWCNGNDNDCVAYVGKIGSNNQKYHCQI